MSKQIKNAMNKESFEAIGLFCNVRLLVRDLKVLFRKQNFISKAKQYLDGIIYEMFYMFNLNIVGICEKKLCYFTLLRFVGCVCFRSVKNVVYLFNYKITVLHTHPYTTDVVYIGNFKVRTIDSFVQYIIQNVGEKQQRSLMPQLNT